MYYAIDTGLGKTRIVLALAQKLKAPLLVLGPLHTILNTWPNEIEKWTPELTYSVLHGPFKTHNVEQLNKDIYLLNYEGLKWFYNYLRQPSSYWKPTMVCYDEASFVKSPSTQRFKILKRLSALHTEYRFALSATPAPEGYHNLWSQYHLLNPDTLDSSYSKYQKSYFRYTGPPVFKTTLIKGQDVEIEKRIGPMTFRLKAEDYLKMPKLIYNKIYVGMPKTLRTKYKTLEKDFYLSLITDTKEKHDVQVNNAAALTNKLRQFIQGGIYTDGGYPDYAKVHSHKINMLKELIESSGNSNIICLVQFRFEIDLLRKALGSKIAIIAGETKATLTQQHIKDWNDRKIPILVCHPASISHGLNLQSGGSIMVWLGLTYSMQTYYQTIRRLYRQGQTSKTVVVHHIMMRKTLDDEIYRVVKAKEHKQNTLLSRLKTYLSDKYS